jgi:TldD protein
MDEVTTDLTHFGIDEQTLTRALGEVLGKKVDDADIFLEHMEGEAISLEEGMVKKASRSIHQGVGIRAVADDRTGYAHSDEIDGDRMLEAARAARSIASDPQAARSVAI